MRKRKRESWPVVVYNYGVLPRGFIDNLPDWIEEEARKMNILWNRLVEISKEYFERYRSTIDEVPEVKEVKEKVEELEEKAGEALAQVKRLRKKLRTKKAPVIQEWEKKRKELLQLLKEKRKELREKRKQVRDRAREVFREMEERINQEVKIFDLHWANREVVRDKFWTIWKKVKKGHFPRFKRFNGNWTLTVRFTSGGMAVPEFLKKFCDKIPSPEVYKLPRRKRNRQAKLHITFNQGKDKAVTIPIIMHRPLPEGGFVKKMVLVRREHGKDFCKWFLQLTVEVPPEEFLEKPPANRKPLAVFEVGFRKVGETEVPLKMPVLRDGKWRKVKVSRKADILRVGVIYNGERIREVCLPAKITAKLEAAGDKQSKADRILQELKDDLRDFFLALINDSSSLVEKLPEFIVRCVKSNQVWGRIRKKGLVEIAEQLEERGLFPELVEEIRSTLARYERFLNVATRMRKKALGYRRKFYENLAKELFNEYEVVVLPEMRLAEMARKEKAEELVRKARFQRFVAGLSELRNCLERRAKKTGSELKVVECKWKTKRCHVCGNLVEYPYPERQFWRCEHCGAEWDVDENAVKNLWEWVRKEEIVE